jgi:RND family efflux transporter MFP subunit
MGLCPIMRINRVQSATYLLTAVVATFGLGAGCGKTSADHVGGGGPPAMPVQVRVAQVEKIPETTEYLSILKSRRSATINPQVEGYVTKIYAKSGDRVSAGTPLLQIDPLKQEAAVGSLQAAHAAQEATVHLAQVQLERERKLFAAGVVPRADLDNAESTYNAAAAQLKSLEQQVNQQQVELRYYLVRAPMDGTVGDIPVRVGDRVVVSTILTTVDEPTGLEAYIYVPADRAGSLRMNAPVHLLDESGRHLADTHITFISPQVDTDTQTVLAKATVENAQGTLRVAQQVRAQVVWGTHEGTVIPILAVVRISGQVFAFLAVREGNSTVARQKLLRIGDTVGNDYAVLDGIKPGDHIILSGLQFLQDGAPVAEQIQQTNASK